MAKIGNLQVGTNNFQDYAISGFEKSTTWNAIVDGFYTRRAIVTASNELMLPVFINGYMGFTYQGTGTTSSGTGIWRLRRTRDGKVLDSGTLNFSGNGTKSGAVNVNYADGSALANETYWLDNGGGGDGGGGAAFNPTGAFFSVLFIKK